MSDATEDNLEAFVVPELFDFINFCQPPCIECVTITVVDFPTTYTFTLEFSDARNIITGLQAPTEDPSGNTTSTSSTIQTSVSRPDSSLDPGGERPHQERNPAWIAGPVVGSILGLFLALGIFLLWIRHRKKSRTAGPPEDQVDKPQLHSDCLPRETPEIHGNPLHEAKGEGLPQPTPWVELPANELVAVELSDRTRRL